jgi:chemotaxis protein CheX
MDAALVAAFSDSAKAVFKDMFGIEAVQAGARALEGSEDHDWDITGLVGLAGQAHGVVAVRLRQIFVTSLLDGSGVASGSAEEGRQLERGLVGEMTNIIAGSAITAMRDLDIEIAPPVIVSGENHKIGWPNIAPVLALVFESPRGGFEIDLCIQPR